MYSCNSNKRETVVKVKTTAWPGFKSAQVCRFDLRYTLMHQELGCKGCTREWDWSYLRQQGLLNKQE